MLSEANHLGLERTKEILHFAMLRSEWQIRAYSRRAVWKNKANFRVVKIGLRPYMKGDYEEFHALKAAKKQSQTKPISRPLAGNPKHEALNSK
jgi:hypothetical protein